MLICRFKTTNLNEHKEEDDDAVDFLKLIWMRERLACVHTKKSRETRLLLTLCVFVSIRTHLLSESSTT